MKLPFFSIPLFTNIAHSSTSGLYGWSSLAHELNVDPTIAKCPVHEMKQSLSGVASYFGGLGLWSRLREWFSTNSDLQPKTAYLSHDNGNRYDILVYIYNKF